MRLRNVANRMTLLVGRWEFRTCQNLCLYLKYSCWIWCGKTHLEHWLVRFCEARQEPESSQPAPVSVNQSGTSFVAISFFPPLHPLLHQQSARALQLLAFSRQLRQTPATSESVGIDLLALPQLAGKLAAQTPANCVYVSTASVFMHLIGFFWLAAWHGRTDTPHGMGARTRRIAWARRHAS